MENMDKIRIAILGASGYTGGELLRLIANHPAMKIMGLSGDRHAGTPVSKLFPGLAFCDFPNLVNIKAIDYSNLDAVFCCLPHGETQKIVLNLPLHLKIVDLSADFRLNDPLAYSHWYNRPHIATDLQKESVYGLTELKRDEIKSARLVANPGCYPTGPQLALVPLLSSKIIKTDNIIIDSKSGVSGAGRGLSESSLFSEVSEGTLPYGIASHRHIPEIEQGLSDASHKPVRISFTPHLIPMNRGILSTLYVTLTDGVEVSDIRAKLAKFYESDQFVSILPEGIVPSTKAVKGTNNCFIGIFKDRISRQAIIVTAIDNLLKGASGQALQNMNVMFGLPESYGLNQLALFP